MDQLLQGLMQPQPQTPAQQFGGMLQGLTAPVLGQQDPRIFQQQADIQNKIQLMHLQGQVDKQRQAKQKIQMDIGKEFLAQDSPEAKKYGAKIFVNQLKGMGVDPEMLQGFEQGLGAGPLTLDKRKQAYIAVRTGADDGYLTDTLGVDKAMVAQLRREAQSDEVYKMLYGKTPGQEATEMQKSINDQRRIDLLEERGRRDDLRLTLQGEKDARLRAEGEQKLSLAERRVRVMEDAGARNQTKLEYMLANGPEEKRQKALDHAELFISQMEKYANLLDQQGFLPKGDKGVIGGLLAGDPSAATAKTKRATDPNNADWVTFSKHLRGDMVGYLRSVQNDIGPRFQKAFDGGIAVMEDPGSLKSLQEVAINMRKAVDTARKGQDTATTLFIKQPNGQVIKVPWKRGMTYDPGDTIVGIE